MVDWRYTKSIPQKSRVGDEDESSDDEGENRDDEEDNEQDEEDEPELGYSQDPNDYDQYFYSPDPVALQLEDYDVQPDEIQGDTGVNEASPNTNKRTRSDSFTNEDRQVRRPRRIDVTDSRPKAKNYEIEVQEVLSTAICHYRFSLSSKDAYLDPLSEIAWAKEPWKEGCRTHQTDIAHTPELLKLVCNSLSFYVQCAEVHSDHGSWKSFTWPGEKPGPEKLSATYTSSKPQPR